MTNPTPTAPDLGYFELCLDVADLDASLAFYGVLGFERIGGELEEGWAVLERDGTRLALYRGHIGELTLNFRDGDVRAIAEALREAGLALEQDAHVESDGTLGATLRDPDGHLVYFNTDGPVER